MKVTIKFINFDNLSPVSVAYYAKFPLDGNRLQNGRTDVTNRSIIVTTEGKELYRSYSPRPKTIVVKIE